jgi:hypothetical protein
MNNKAIICVIRTTTSLEHFFNTRLDQLENRHTPEEISDGIFQYYIDNLQSKGQFDPDEVDWLAFKSIDNNVFILTFDIVDYVVILESSKYYKWFNNMFSNGVIITYTEQVITNHVMDIILDNPNKKLIVYKNGIRQ